MPTFYAEYMVANKIVRVVGVYILFVYWGFPFVLFLLKPRV